jgi:hypothetical protein
MMKRRVLAIVISLTLMATATGLSSIAADALGYPVTSQASACGSSAGGDC